VIVLPGRWRIVQLTRASRLAIMPENTNPENNVFEAALLWPEGAERATFLDRECRNDPKLRARVELMLQGHLNAHKFLEYFPDRLTEEQPAPPENAGVEQPCARIGPYKLLQKLGEGGCGLVYLAEQDHPVRRRVAIKVIKLGMDTRSVVARFEAERQALALMDHPNIAKVFDVGTAETGRPYFVMELVRGIRINQYCTENHLSTEARLNLFIQVCHAIQHAHQKGIIHRDIKPSNILVTLHDGVAVPKVIDFGIAKATCEQRLTDKTIFTAFEQFIGTPAYVSPEQAEMSGLDIDTRSDIYSLGVLLYELLTGNTPFDSKELLVSGLDAMRKTIREKEPIRPSTKLNQTVRAEIARGQSFSSEEQIRAATGKYSAIHNDLDWIIMKCLEKDRRRRYETANGLGSDIQRHLNNEAVLARPPSPGYRLQKLFRRNKIAFTAATAIAVAVVIGLGASTVMFIRERSARKGEQQQRFIAQAEQQRANAQAKKASDSELQSRRSLYANQVNLAGETLAEDDLSRTRELLARQIPATGDTNDLRGFEWRYLWQQSRSAELATLGQHDGAVHGVRFSPDGTLLASSEINGTVKLWESLTRKLIATFREETDRGPDWIDMAMKALAFSPSGRQIAVGVGNSIVLRDVFTHERIALANAHSKRVNFLAFAAGGKILASGGDDGVVKLWDLSSAVPREIVGLTVGFNITCVAFSMDGKTLAASSFRGPINRWDVSNPESPIEMPLLGSATGHSSWVMAVAFSPRTNMLVSAGTGGDLIAWDSATDPKAVTARKLSLPRGSIAMVNVLGFTPDGQTMISGGSDNNITLWDVSGRVQPLKLKGHEWGVFSIDVSPDGRMLASAGDDRKIKLWDISEPWREKQKISHGEWMHAVAISPDAKLIACLSQGRVSLWDAASEQLVAEDRTPRTNGTCLAFSPDSKIIAAESEGDGRIGLLKVPSLEPITKFPGRRPQFSVNGSELAYLRDSEPETGDKNISIRWRNLKTQEERVWRTDWDWVRCLALSADGQHIAVARSRSVRIWKVDSPDHHVDIEAKPGDENLPDYGLWDLAFSPDGHWLASSSWDTRVRLWNLEKPNDVIQPFKAHSGAAWAVAFSPDNRTLATGGNDATIKLWNLASLQQTATLRGHTGPVDGLAFSPDGSLLVSSSGDGTARLWRAPSFDEIRSQEDKNSK
jgi:WD40 repeat protein/serine/threonine protein kinase